MEFSELTYASPADPWLKRSIIRAIERFSGRNYFVPYYKRWKDEIVPAGGPVIRPIFDLIDVKLEIASGSWPPPAIDRDAPVVIVANHPYGIVDGLGALALAEDLGRPFRVLINKDLLKVPEIRPYSLPVDFGETRAAQANNLEMRKEAVRLLKEGTTIVIFPAGGVCTSPTPWGRAVDLPWKTFTARLISSARAQVIPLYFEGQCGPAFQAASWMSLTLRLSLIVAEFRRIVGRPLRVHVGDLIPAATLAAQKDRIALMEDLHDKVWAMSGLALDEVRRRTERLPTYLLGSNARAKD